MDLLVFNQFTFILVAIAMSLISAVFMVKNPLTRHRENSEIIKYFAAYFLLTFAGSLTFLTRPFIPETISVLLTNFFFLSNLYCLKYGLLWRQGHTSHLFNNKHAGYHILLFVCTQLILTTNLAESEFWLTLNHSINVIIVLFFMLPLVNLNRTHAPPFGEVVTTHTLYFVITSYAIAPLIFLFTGNYMQYQSLILVLHLLVIFVLFGGLQCLIMSDVFERQYQTSIRDPLTGIFNRRHFFQQVKEVAAMQTQDMVNSVIVCDIDNFKDVNEKYGHDVGDTVLINFAHLITDITGNFGLVSRFGGEEFAILLRNHALHEAIKLAEQLRHACQSIQVPTDAGQIKITASFGVAQIWDMPEIDLTIKLADNALLSAKEAGRNRVCSA